MPLSVALANFENDVTECDISNAAVEKVNSAQAPFWELSLDEALLSDINKGFRATLDVSCFRSAEIVPVIVGLDI